MSTNVMLCGVGGQGILFAAKVMACAAELSGYEVTTNELHGMAQRGGSVTAQVRFGSEVLRCLARVTPMFAHWSLSRVCVAPIGCVLAVIRDFIRGLIPVNVSTRKRPILRIWRSSVAFVQFPKLLDCADTFKLGDMRLANGDGRRIVGGPAADVELARRL